MNDLISYIQPLLSGLFVTIKLAFSALALGLVLSVLIAYGQLFAWRWVKVFLQSIVTFVRGVPELLIVFMVYFCGTIAMTKLLGHYVEVSPFLAGVVALGVIYGAYGSEVLKGAYGAIPLGQTESANAFGFSSFTTFRRILLPQMWQHGFAGLGNQWLVLLKDTALVSLIGTVDMMSVAQNASIATGQPFLFYGLVALVYLALTSLSILLQNKLVRKAKSHLAVEC